MGVTTHTLAAGQLVQMKFGNGDDWLRVTVSRCKSPDGVEEGKVEGENGGES